MFTIQDGKFYPPCNPAEEVGKSIVIDKYMRPDEFGKETAKRIGTLVGFRQIHKNGKITNLLTVEYKEDNHYAEKTISSYHLDKIAQAVILS